MVFRLGLGWFGKNQLEVLKKVLKQTQARKGDFIYLNTDKRFFPKSLENAFVIYEVSLDCNRTIFKDFFFHIILRASVNLEINIGPFADIDYLNTISR